MNTGSSGRDDFAHGVDEIKRSFHPLQRGDLDGRVRHHARELDVIPDIGGQRRDVEIAGDDGVVAQAVKSGEVIGDRIDEFEVCARIWD